MKLFRAASMRAVDLAAEKSGLPGRTLMANAGAALVAAVREHYPRARRVAVLCGRGNNGGDGHVVAQLLHRAGLGVDLFELGPASRDDAAHARSLAVEALGPPTPLDEPAGLAALAAALAGCELAIDALFGSGLSRPLAGAAAAAVAALNEAATPVLSVDVPSGVDADRALAPGVHVRAERTVQLAGAKLASVLLPVRAAFGRWSVADIGVPAALLSEHADAELLEAAALRSQLPTRSADAHKYRVGTVLVVGGSLRYLGAAELACRAAYRGGAGLVTLAAEARFAGGWPEVVFEPLAGATLSGALTAAGSARSHTLVAGPGLDPGRAGEIPALLERHPGPVLLDAGALQPDEALRAAVARHGGCVLTPHHGEAARLLGHESEMVRGDPLTAAQRLAADWRATVILKGAGAVIAAPDGRALVSDRGHPGMAVGGSGDVLAGLAGAWLHGGDPLWRAAAATYLHGLAGELAAERYGDGLVATDLIDQLPAAWRVLRGSEPGTGAARGA